MNLNSSILKVRLSLSEGIDHGTFTEGIAIAEAIGSIVGVVVEYENGEANTTFGRVVAVQDATINKAGPVTVTEIWFEGMADPLTIEWGRVSVAVAEVAQEGTVNIR